MQVAQSLHRRGLGTLLFDLLQPDEALDRGKVFDIELLGQRMVEAIDWVDRIRRWPPCRSACSVPAPAPRLRWWLPRHARSACTRWSRAEAGPIWHRPRFRASRRLTLLIVGGADKEVLSLNQQALRRLKPGSELVIVAHATHLFEEPGALDKVMALAGNWFTRHLQELRDKRASE